MRLTLIAAVLMAGCSKRVEPPPPKLHVLCSTPTASGDFLVATTNSATAFVLEGGRVRVMEGKRKPLDVPSETSLCVVSNEPINPASLPSLPASAPK